MNDRGLIERFKNGENEAFDELVRQYYSESYQFFLRIAQDSMDADDLCQETFIRVFKGLKRFRMESEFTTWLYRISVNVANSYLRKRRIKDMASFREELDPVANGGQEEAEGFNPVLWKAIERLPRKQRTSLVLRIFHELPFKEVAGVMGISENSAKVNYHYAISKLRTAVGTD